MAEEDVAVAASDSSLVALWSMLVTVEASVSIFKVEGRVVALLSLEGDSDSA